MTTTEDKIKSQEKLVDRLQSKLDRALDLADSHEIKEETIALQAAIDGLVALKTLAQSDYAEFEARLEADKSRKKARHNNP